MTKIETMLGAYPVLDIEEYHGHKESISRSALMDFIASPHRYYANHINPKRPARTSTPAMQFGQAFHDFILEHESFNARYAIEPEKVLLKDVGREKYDAFKARCNEIEMLNQVVLSNADWGRLLDMNDALLNSKAMELVTGGTFEQSYFWEDEETGLVVKARPDILHANMIVDLKTCADASPRAFQASMVKGGYHVQGAMIQEAVRRVEGREIDTVINVAIETSYPYSIGIYIIDEVALSEGHYQFKKALVDLKHAIGHNVWEDYGVQTLSLPAWAFN